MKNVVLVIFVLSTLLGACTVKPGHQVLAEMSEADISANLIKGHTTKEKTKLLFGEPTKTHYHPDNKEIWVYDVKSKNKGFAFIPATFFTYKEINIKAKTLRITFDKNGIIENYRFLHSEDKHVLQNIIK